MPPVATPRIEAVADLARQLRYAPRATLLRHIAKAEAVAPDIDPAASYPEDWLIFRVTGYRPEIEAAATLVGEALLGDLSALVERLTESAGLVWDDMPAGSLTANELGARWGVSRKTLDRYRRRGLIARRVDTGGGHRVLAFTPGCVELFERRNGERLARAGSFRRIDGATEADMLELAQRSRARFGWSMSETAARLSQRYGRSHEAVRGLLKRADAQRDEPVFTEPGPPTPRQRRLIHRCVSRGIEPSELARRMGRSKPSVLRALNQRRAELLRELSLAGPIDAAWRADEALVFLSPPGAAGLMSLGEIDLAEFLQRARERVVPIAVEETGRAHAFHRLRADAADMVASLDATTAQAELLDRIETKLRWAAMLKAQLMRPHLALLIETLEAGLKSRLDELPAPMLLGLIKTTLAAAGDAIDHFDPGHGGRLAAPIGLAAARVAANSTSRLSPGPSGRAARRLAPGSATIVWTRCVSPRLIWLAPDPRVAAVLDRLEESQRDILGPRLGLLGQPPVTTTELAALLERPRMHIARDERLALRRAIELARSG